MKRNILLMVAMLWVFAACNNTSKEEKTDNTEGTPTVKTSTTSEASVAENQASNKTETSSNVTVKEVSADEKTSDSKIAYSDIKFDELNFDFGEISEGTVAKHTFKFTNTGKIPLVIKAARGSCGCTVPKWPREPIAPGKTGEIKVEFNSQGRSGVQTKTVTLNTNTEEGTQTLQIKAKVSATSKMYGPLKK